MKKTVIATAKVEDLIENLKTSYTVVIVTHNVLQAARVSGCAAFMMLGELGEANTLTEDHITGRIGRAGPGRGPEEVPCPRWNARSTTS